LRRQVLRSCVSCHCCHLSCREDWVHEDVSGLPAHQSMDQQVLSQSSTGLPLEAVAASGNSLPQLEAAAAAGNAGCGRLPLRLQTHAGWQHCGLSPW
jgi:hypothetical protein